MIGSESAATRTPERRRPARKPRPGSVASLREANRLLRMAEQLARLGRWRVDPADGLVEASAEARNICGLNGSARLSPLDALRLIAPPDRPEAIAAIRAALKSRRKASFEARLCSRDGKLRQIAVHMQSDRSPGSASPGLFGVVRDITDKLVAEEILTAARDEAQSATVAKSEFLATMSHEIRTPMTGVIGMIDLLRSNPTEEERDRYLAAMKQSADMLMSVLDGILDFSKVEYGKMELVCRDFDLEKLVEQTSDMFQNGASKKGLVLEVHSTPGESPIVHGDPIRLQQVISNLISNALKFTDDGKVRIDLRATPSGPGRQQWRVAVSDTGVGIDSAHVRQLFQPFVQIGNRSSGGTGLGLAISRRLVEAMNGSTGVHSRPGSGSTFWFEVDLPVGRAAAASPEVRDSDDPDGEPLHVLVAEDNPVNQMLIAALLRRLGHRVTCVDNGLRALEAAHAVPYDCILLDMQMPKMDGITAARAIRSRPGINADIPIIALTADAAPERRRFYDNAGLTDFMTKPVSAEALRRRLAAIPPRALPGKRQSSDPALDTERVAELVSALGSRRLNGLLEMLETEMIDRPLAIRAALAEHDYARVKTEAHSLKGAAANVGAAGIATAAKALELALPGPELDLALATLDREIKRTRAAIEVVVRPQSEPLRKSA